MRQSQTVSLETAGADWADMLAAIWPHLQSAEREVLCKALNLRRNFSPHASLLDRLGRLAEEIGELLKLDSGEDRIAARALAMKRLVQLDARIAELQQSRQSLQLLVAECAEGKTGACPIIETFATGLTTDGLAAGLSGQTDGRNATREIALTPQLG
jgi:hypothetical protein